MQIKYDSGYAYMDGYKFRKDTDKGYYLSTKKIGTSRKRLHVYVWEKHNGPVPKKHEVHHLDENKDNNEIDNLLCMTKADHLKWHSENISSSVMKMWRDNLEKNARPKAIQWHKSEEGLEWHKKQAEKHLKGKNHKKRIEKQCEYCSSTFKTSLKRARFCSPNCRTQYRRVSGIDNELRKCVICNKEFTTNKYYKVKTCSKDCSNKSQLITKGIEAQ